MELLTLLIEKIWGRTLCY